MKKKKIRVLEIKPMEHPRVCSIEPSKEAFISAVRADVMEHGGVEAKRIDKSVCILFNKDRFLADLTPNRQIGDDIICGTIYVVGVDDKNLVCSLSKEQIDKYTLQFRAIEHFDDMDVAEANLNTIMSRFWENEKF